MAGEYYVALLTIIGTVITILLTLGLGLNKVHNPIKLFFIWFAFLLFVPMANLGLEIAESASVSADIQEMADTIYWAVVIVDIIATIYLGYYFTKSVLEQFTKISNKQKQRSML